MKIQLQGLSVRFGAVEALRAVSLALEPGAVTVLLGPNGAGKSTLLSALIGLVKLDAGAVIVDGLAGQGLSRADRAKLGYLPEAVAFADNLSGRQVARFFASAKGQPASRAEAALARVGLQAAAGRAVRGYSRGMRQRLGLAVAILGDPALLVLDEPTGGLDQEGLSLLWEILAEWRAAQRTVLVSSHDLALIERRADQVAILREGRLAALGTPDALRRQVALPVRLRIDPAEPSQAAALLDALAARGLGPGRLLGDQLVLSVGPDRLLEALQVVGDQAGRVRHVRVEEPGFDEVYATLLGGP